MQEVKVVVVGNIKEKFYRNKIEQYISVISKKYNITIVELKDESIPSNAGNSMMQDIKEREGERILQNITGRDYVIALCIEGKATDSAMLQKELKKAQDKEADNIIFVIGGSLGLSERVVKRADYRLSFGRMTYPHQLMRVMLLCQISKLNNRI